MSDNDFSFDELKRLIKEQLGERFPKGLSEAEAPEPPNEGLLELQVIAKLQRTFTPSEKASALNQLGIAGSKDPWDVIGQLAEKVTNLTQLQATCPDDLIKNVFLIASLADLLYSERGAQAKGWFMEEWLAQVTGGKVEPPSESTGTEDVTIGQKGYSVKLTKVDYIQGSVNEYLFGLGYGAFVDPKTKTIYYVKDFAQRQKLPVDYIHFLKVGDDTVNVYKVTGEEIMEEIGAHLKPAPLPDSLQPWAGKGSTKNPARDEEEKGSGGGEAFVFPNGRPKNLFAKISNASTAPISIKINLQDKINLANEEAANAFKRFKAIAVAFDEMTQDLSLFYAQPGPSQKGEAVAKTLRVGEAVEAYQGCE